MILIKTNEEMLELVRGERPQQVIHRVNSFELNKHGFYNVRVDMEEVFFGTRIHHVHVMLPYPTEEYMKMTELEQLNWRFDNM